jgi:hypothetical protein
MKKRITITQDVMDAFDFLYGLYTDAVQGTDEEWHSEEDKKKIQKLQKKIYGVTK